jgi:phage-related protein
MVGRKKNRRATFATFIEASYIHLHIFVSKSRQQLPPKQNTKALRNIKEAKA